MSGALDNKVTIFPPQTLQKYLQQTRALSSDTAIVQFQLYLPLLNRLYQHYFNLKLITLPAQNINLANLSDIKINQLQGLSGTIYFSSALQDSGDINLSSSGIVYLCNSSSVLFLLSAEVFYVLVPSSLPRTKISNINLSILVKCYTILFTYTTAMWLPILILSFY